MNAPDTEPNVEPTNSSDYTEQLSSVHYSKQQLDDFSSIVEQSPNSQYQTPLSQIDFLCFLIKSLRACSVLEIGTYRGFTSMCFASALGEAGRVTTLEHNVTSARKSAELWKLYGAQNIELRVGLAVETMQQLIADFDCFDFIYIDADKDSYAQYYELALQLAHAGSVIALDNMLLHGSVAQHPRPNARAQLLHDLNTNIFNSSVNAAFVPGWDGLVLVHVLG